MLMYELTTTSSKDKRWTSAAQHIQLLTTYVANTIFMSTVIMTTVQNITKH